MENFIDLNSENISSEHICCAISDKKCADSYQAKKDWLKQGFEETERISSGFSLLAMKFDESMENPKFNESVKSGECPDKKGIVVYYSNRCPYVEFHAKESLIETAKNRNLLLKVIKLNTMEEAQNCPSPATIFSLFLDGKFMTTDVSVCMDSRYDKVIEKLKK